jgi:O-antigen ligase
VPTPSRLATGWVPSRTVRWAFCGLLFSLPLEYPDRSIPLEVHTITGALFLLIALTQPAVCYRRPPLAFWFLAIYLWSYAAMALFSEHSGEAGKLLLNYVLVLMLFWVGANLLRQRAMVQAALWSFVLGCTLIAALNVLGVGTRSVVSDETTRQIVFGQDANLLGGNMGLALVTLMALTFRPGTRLLAAGTFVAAAIAFILAKSLMLAGSRGAITAVAAGVLAFSLQTSSVRMFVKNAAVALLVVVALIGVVYRSDSMRKRYERTLNEGSMSGRERLFPEAWEMFQERPLLGWGPIDNMYELGLRTAGWELGKKNADGRSLYTNRDTHNLMLDVLTSVGLIGGLPLFLCLAGCLANGWSARAGPHGTAPFAIAVVVLCISMNTNWSASKQGWLMFAYAAASRRRSHGSQPHLLLHSGPLTHSRVGTTLT